MGIKPNLFAQYVREMLTGKANMKYRFSPETARHK